jgi:hypothetical protein
MNRVGRELNLNAVQLSSFSFREKAGMRGRKGPGPCLIALTLTLSRREREPEFLN